MAEPVCINAGRTVPTHPKKGKEDLQVRNTQRPAPASGSEERNKKTTLKPFGDLNKGPWGSWKEVNFSVKRTPSKAKQTFSYGKAGL